MLIYIRKPFARKNDNWKRFTDYLDVKSWLVGLEFSSDKADIPFSKISASGVKCDSAHRNNVSRGGTGTNGAFALRKNKSFIGASNFAAIKFADMYACIATDAEVMKPNDTSSLILFTLDSDDSANVTLHAYLVSITGNIQAEGIFTTLAYQCVGLA